MAGYLDNYGAGEEQREKLIKRVVIVLVAVIVVGGLAFFFLKNYRQESPLDWGYLTFAEPKRERVRLTAQRTRNAAAEES